MKAREVIKIYDPQGKQRIIGWLEGPVFVKQIEESKHLYRNLNALTLDLPTFQKIAGRIKAILYQSPTKDYSTTPDEFVIHGKELKAPRDSNGYPKYRDHIALNLQFWKIKEKPQVVKVEQGELF